MKKLHSCMCVILIMALILTACAQKKTVEKSSSIYNDTVTDSGENIVVGYSQIGSESDWRNANTESFKSTFTEENGYYLLFEDAQQKQENQLKAVRNFILQNVDYIVLDPIVETGWDDVLLEAKDAGIPVILSDRYIEVSDDELYTCWVGSDFDLEGARAGQWLKDYLEAQGRSDETINIVTLQGTLDSSAQLGRSAGFESVRKEQSNWNMLARESGDFTQVKGQEVMESFLKTYDDIDVVVSENDNMTFGAIDALREAGKTFGVNGDIIIISFDAVNAALSVMAEGDINADFECNPLLGPEVAEIIEQLEAGKTVEKIRYIDETYFDASMDLEKLIKARTY